MKRKHYIIGVIALSLLLGVLPIFLLGYLIPDGLVNDIIYLSLGLCWAVLVGGRFVHPILSKLDDFLTARKVMRDEKDRDS